MVQRVSNAPINVMPHYHRYGIRWGKMGICIPENYNSPPTGKVATGDANLPTNLPVAKSGVGENRMGFAIRKFVFR